ncbi:MAG: hypothetical protein ABEK50_17180, partial [bacterium]
PRETLHFASEESEEEVEQRVRRLCDRGFIVDGDDDLTFENRSIRTTCRDMILPRERKEFANRVLDRLGKRRRSTRFRPILPDLLRDAERTSELRRLQSIQAYQHLRAFREREAKQLLEKAGSEPWADTSEGRRARASYLNARARLAETNNNFEEGLRLHQQAVEILRDLDDPDDLAHGLILVSRMAIKCKEWEVASEATEESLEISRQLEDSNAVAKSTYMMGWLSEVQDDWESALEWYKKTLSHEGREEGMGRAYSVSGIARAYENLDREAEALPYHEESIEVMSHDEWMQRNPHVYALNLESYGWLEWKLNGTARGVDYMTKSLEVALQTGDHPVVVSLLNRLVHVANKAGASSLAGFFITHREQYLKDHPELEDFSPPNDYFELDSNEQETDLTEDIREKLNQAQRITRDNV